MILDKITRHFNDLTSMYEIYIDRILLPIAPSKIEIKTKNMNKTYELVNGSEFNFLKEQGLKTITFDAILPSTRYPFCLYKNNIFKEAKEFIEELKELKENKKPFMLKIIRGVPYNDNIKVSFEEFSIIESSDEGRDILVKFTFKEYNDLIIREIIPINKSGFVNSIKSSDLKANSTNDLLLTQEIEHLAITKIKRPLSSNIDLATKTQKINAKNLILTSRKYTSTPDKFEDIKKATKITSNLEKLPKSSWW